MAKMEVLHLTPTQRGELHAFLRSRNLPASVAQRMRIGLMLDAGISYHDIQEKLGTPPSTISRWKQRYEKEAWLAWQPFILASHHRSSQRSCVPRCWNGRGKFRQTVPPIGRCAKWRQTWE